jgi:hypothetical protein
MSFRQGPALDAGSAATSEGDNSEMEDATTDVDEVEEHEPQTLDEKERFWKEVCHMSRLVFLPFT